MYKNLLLPQPNSASTYFLTWFNQWPSILKTDYQESVIEVTNLKNQAPSYSIFEPNIYDFKAIDLTS